MGWKGDADVGSLGLMLSWLAYGICTPGVKAEHPLASFGKRNSCYKRVALGHAV